MLAKTKAEVSLICNEKSESDEYLIQLSLYCSNSDFSNSPYSSLKLTSYQHHSSDKNKKQNALEYKIFLPPCNYAPVLVWETAQFKPGWKLAAGVKVIKGMNKEDKITCIFLDLLEFSTKQCIPTQWRWLPLAGAQVYIQKDFKNQNSGYLKCIH